MKKNRCISFIIVGIIYVLASILGIYLYNILDFSFYFNLLIADVVCTGFVFLFSLLLKNASVYDPYWSVQPIVIVLAFAFKREFSLATFVPMLAILLWGIRLTVNWAYTFKNLEHQDWRYTMLKEKTKGFYPIVNFLGIHLFPTLIVYLCVLPIVFLYQLNCKFNAFTIVFSLISFFAFLLQGIADIQMHKFRKNKNSVFIRNGLWKYSRHPNYLGEILMWWGIGLACVFTMMSNYYLLFGAFCNTLMFLIVSIPMAENHQRLRKEGFDEYKRETRMLLPIKK